MCMKREYIGGDVLVWSDEHGKPAVDVERIGSNPNGWISLMVCSKDGSSGTRWLTPAEAREIATALNAYAETIEKDKGYCHDPFAKNAESP